MLQSASPPADPSSTVAVGPNGSMVEAYRLAAKALGDMQRHRVYPTPQAYELWLAYHSDADPGLTRRMTEMLASGNPVTPAAIEVLRQEFEIDGTGDREPASERYLDVSDDLQDAAEALVQHAADGRVAIRDYGEVLARTVVQLGEEPSRADSMRVITLLSTETVKMAEHNRDLRERLASTSARVEKLRRMLADEKQAASTDQLTSLPNRRAFDGRLKRALAKIATDGGTSATLLLLDVDHFKRFNDTYGHSTGDLVLRLVGRLLVENIKGRDIAARYGGEEFAILLVGADLDAGANVARQICTTLANQRFKLTRTTEQGQGRVTISIGVAQLRTADSPGSVMDRADAALYAAKHAGRNRVLTEREIVSG